ncbi:MAG: PKD domain-containing protein [Acidimicrobiia bacterium]|nr:PKD domain-containing protein [Acidimicrobiia bacterium]
MALLLLAASLAGCTDDGPTEDPENPDGMDGSDDMCPDLGNVTATRPGPDGCDVANSAPVATLVANVTAAEVPFDVLFSFNASDADGDVLEWTFDADGDGTADLEGIDLPGELVFAFADPGLYTANFTVDDGDAAHWATVTVNATAPAATGNSTGNATSFDPILVTLEMVEGCELCIDSELIPTVGQLGAQGCIGFHLGINEIDCGWVEIPPEAIGTPFSVRSELTGQIQAVTGTDGDPDVEFYDTCSASGTSLGIQRTDAPPDFEAGIIPDGAGCLIVFEFHWPNLGHMVEVSIGANIHG